MLLKIVQPELGQWGGGNFEWLSSLRGLMVLMVFISHQHIPFCDKDTLFVIGRIGVAGFFLMSGYLAVGSLARRNTKQFLLNRFMRIYPVFWLLIIIKFLLCWPKFSITELLLTMTTFQEFVGIKAQIIGASWMLPIMVVFFVILALCKGNKRWLTMSFYALCVSALIIGFMRMLTGKPFPTALCLLQLVGLLGYFYHERGLGREVKTKLCCFEGVLVAASYMSYDYKVIFYFVAYNIGILVFYCFKRYNLSVRSFDRLGELGFTFFLGAGIPILFIGLFCDVESLHWIPYITLKFVLAIVFAWVITKYIEKPLLSIGKKWEIKFA